MSNRQHELIGKFDFKMKHVDGEINALANFATRTVFNKGGGESEDYSLHSVQAFLGD